MSACGVGRAGPGGLASAADPTSELCCELLTQTLWHNSQVVLNFYNAWHCPRSVLCLFLFGPGRHSSALQSGVLSRRFPANRWQVTFRFLLYSC